MTESSTQEKPLYALIVDDELSILDLIAELMPELSLVALCAKNVDEAEFLLEKHSREIAVIVSDHAMPGKNGLEFRAGMLGDYKEIPFVVVSGAITKEMALDAVELKVSAFVGKPFKREELARVVVKECKDRVETLKERYFLQDLFIQEAGEILEDLEELLLALEDNPHDPDNINTIFRLVHTIKGSSGVLEIEALTNYVHAFEDILAALKAGQCLASKEILGVLISAYDRTKIIIAELAAGTFDESVLPQETADLRNSITNPAGTELNEISKKENLPTKKTAKAQSNKKDGIVVPRDLLDEFMAISGEITVVRNMVNKCVASLERKMPTDQDVTLLSDLLDEMNKINTGMQNQITELRKVPMSQVLRKLPRTVRDVAKALNKEVAFAAEGDDLRVDTAISQALTNSLIHMVRNCVDHGMEMPDTRESNGKPKAGTVKISCRGDDQNVYVTVADDGGGIDPRKIAEKAVEKGLVSQGEIENLPKQKILALIFEPGFSTAAQITDVSGRGVGMDMVKSSVADLGGRVEIDSNIGKGTSISMILPIPKSVVIIQSLIVKAGDKVFAIPQDDVRRLVKIEDDKIAEQVKELEGGNVVLVDGKLLPLVELAALMETSPVGQVDSEKDRESLNLVVMNSEIGEYALIVDNIMDSEDVVVKPLLPCVNEKEVYRGATFMGDGLVGLILDANGIAGLSNLELEVENKASNNAKDYQPSLENEVLIVNLGTNENFAMPLDQINRLEVFSNSEMQKLGINDSIVYRGNILPIIDLNKLIGDIVNPPSDSAADNNVVKIPRKTTRNVVVVPGKERSVGLAIEEVIDVVYCDSETLGQEAMESYFEGALIIADKTITKLSLANILSDQGFQPSDVMLGVTEAAQEETRNENFVEKKVSGDQEIAAEEEFDAAAGWGLF